MSSPIFLTCCHGKTGASISISSSFKIFRCSIIITALVPSGMAWPVLTQKAFLSGTRVLGESSLAPKLIFASNAIPSIAAAWKLGEDMAAIAGLASTLFFAFTTSRVSIWVSQFSNCSKRIFFASSILFISRYTFLLTTIFSTH